MSVDSRCDHNTIWLAADCRSLSYSTRYAMRFAQQQDVSYASFLMAVILNFPACFKHSRSSMCATTPTRPVPTYRCSQSTPGSREGVFGGMRITECGKLSRGNLPKIRCGFFSVE